MLHRHADHGHVHLQIPVIDALHQVGRRELHDRAGKTGGRDRRGGAEHGGQVAKGRGRGPVMHHKQFDVAVAKRDIVRAEQPQSIAFVDGPEIERCDVDGPDEIGAAGG